MRRLDSALDSKLRAIWLKKCLLQNNGKMVSLQVDYTEKCPQLIEIAIVVSNHNFMKRVSYVAGYFTLTPGDNVM